MAEAELQDILTAFQKSLARANQATQNVRKREVDYLSGMRALYVIDSLEVELKASVDMADSDGDDKPDRITLNLNPAPEKASTFRFAVSSSPLQPVDREELILTPVASDKELREGLNRFTAWHLGPKPSETPPTADPAEPTTNAPFQPQPNQKLVVVFTPETEPDNPRFIEATTNSLGRIDFEVDTQSGQITVTSPLFKSKINFKESPLWFVHVEATITTGDGGSTTLRSESLRLHLPRKHQLTAKKAATKRARSVPAKGAVALQKLRNRRKKP